MEKKLNKKYLELMLEKINLYRKNQISLRTLIDDLESLLNILENIEEKWLDHFLSFWSTLEIIYSTNFVENKKINTIDKNKINKILTELKKIISIQKKHSEGNS